MCVVEKIIGGFMCLYNSWEWKRVRYEALLKYGSKCMLCGSNNRIVVDHVLPVKKYPKLALDLSNLQILCNDCNMGKAQRCEDFRNPVNFTKTTENLAKIKNGLIYHYKTDLSYSAKEHVVINGKTLCLVEKCRTILLREKSEKIKIIKFCKKCRTLKENTTKA